LSELKSHKEIYEPIKSVLTEYWKRFIHLEDQAREMWIYGTWLLHFGSDDPRMQSQCERSASAEFAKVVEVTLLRVVFSHFREYAKKTPEVDQMARAGLESDEFGSFSKFLVWKDAPFSLGQMLHVLTHYQDTRDSLFRQLGMWLERHYLDLSVMIDKLNTINSFRRPEAHGKKAKKDPHVVRDLCRKVLEVLTRP
jgi:hypothetical protein